MPRLSVFSGMAAGALAQQAGRARAGRTGAGKRAEGAGGVRKGTAVGRDARRHLHQPQHLALPGLLVDDEQSAAAGADVQVPAALTVATPVRQPLEYRGERRGHW